jgi:hypothetical protein
MAMKREIVAMAALLIFIFAFGGAWAFKVPHDSPEDLLKDQNRQLNETIKAQYWAIILLCIIILFSLVVNIFLFLSLWRAQKQASDSLDTVRNINLMKETAIKIAGSARRSEGEIIKDLASEDLDSAEIKIVRSGF